MKWDNELLIETFRNALNNIFYPISIVELTKLINDNFNSNYIIGLIKNIKIKPFYLSYKRLSSLPNNINIDWTKIIR